MIKPIVIALIKKGDKYLMTKRVSFDPFDKEFYPYVWQFPGGGLEFGETPEKTAKREMIEEIGVEVEIISLIPKIYTEIRNNWQGVFVCFLCKLKNEKTKIILNDEASEFDWFTIEQISKLKLMPITFEMVLEAKKINI